MVQKQRASYLEVKKKLRGAQLKYALLFPARLKVIHGRKSHFFESPADAEEGLEVMGLDGGQEASQAAATGTSEEGSSSNCHPSSGPGKESNRRGPSRERQKKEQLVALSIAGTFREESAKITTDSEDNTIRSDSEKKPRGKQNTGTESAGEPPLTQSSSTEDPAAVPITPSQKPTRKELAVRARQRKLQAIVEAYRRLVDQAEEEEEEAAAAAAASSNAPGPKPAGLRRRGQAAARRRVVTSSAAPPQQQQHACKCRCRDFQAKILRRVASKLEEERKKLEDGLEERVKIMVDKHLKARRL
ncbi:uncharacterized protein LOC144768991 [Lissotriton helveticus]